MPTRTERDTRPVVATEWHNPCFGKRWRSLANGTIEFEGQGVVTLPAGEGPSRYRRFVRNTWRNFRPEIERAARKRGVPVNWVLAIAATETGIASGSRERQSGLLSTRPAQGCGPPVTKCCYGPMAIMVCPSPNHRTFGGYERREDMLDPEKNIDTGAAILRHFMDQGLDLPAISARYNAGGLCCPNSPLTPSKPGGRVKNAFNLCSAAIAGTSYPMLSSMMNNFAVLELGVRPNGGGWLNTALYAAGGAALVGAAGLLFIATRQ